MICEASGVFFYRSSWQNLIGQNPGTDLAFKHWPFIFNPVKEKEKNQKPDTWFWCVCVRERFLFLFKHPASCNHLEKPRRLNWNVSAEKSGTKILHSDVRGSVRVIWNPGLQSLKSKVAQQATGFRGKFRFSHVSLETFSLNKQNNCCKKYFITQLIKNKICRHFKGRKLFYSNVLHIIFRKPCVSPFLYFCSHKLISVFELKGVRLNNQITSRM